MFGWCSVENSQILRNKTILFKFETAKRTKLVVRATQSVAKAF